MSKRHKWNWHSGTSATCVCGAKRKIVERKKKVEVWRPEIYGDTTADDIVIMPDGKEYIIPPTPPCTRK